MAKTSRDDIFLYVVHSNAGTLRNIGPGMEIVVHEKKECYYRFLNTNGNTIELAVY